MVENARPILRAEVWALAIQLRRVVIFPKDVQKLIVRHLGRIVVHFHRLGVSGAVRTHVFVGRVPQFPTGITHTSSRYARNLAERGFNSPKTPSRKCSFWHNSFTLS